VTGTRELPRFVDQLRALLWFQMFLSLIGLIVVIIIASIISKQDLLVLDTAAANRRDALERQLFLTMAALIVIAVFVWISAKLLWRGWKWVYLLALLAQALAVTVTVGAVTSGLAGGLIVLLYAALTGWILVDLFRGEVLAYVWRGRR
jgi:cell division protein FtsW (lipid II flippase)